MASETFSFTTLVGKTLLQKDPLPEECSHLIPDKSTYRWKGIECDHCNSSIVGKRYQCKEDNFDLCHTCIDYAFEDHPQHILAPVPIPDQNPCPTISNVATETALNGKYVLLYFGAEWCGFCPPFSEELMLYYERMQARQVALEVVYVSQDNDNEGFDSYYGSMPWLAVPFSECELREKLKIDLEAEGVPTAVLLDPHGNVIDKEARFVIQADSEGLHFPYPTRSLKEILSGPLMRPNGEFVDASILDGKYLGLYFNSSWTTSFGLPDSRPVVEKAHAAAVSKGHPFEILFCTQDFDSAVVESFHKSMPWMMHPLKSAKYISHELSCLIERGVGKYTGYGPWLVILDLDHRILNVDAFSTIKNDLEATSFPWLPAPVVDIQDGVYTSGGSLSDTPSVVAYCETLDVASQEKIYDSLTNLAKDNKSMAFFTSKYVGNKDWSDLAETVKKHAGAERVESPLALVVDAKKNEYYVHTGALEESTLRELVQQFNAGELTMTIFKEDDEDSADEDTLKETTGEVVNESNDEPEHENVDETIECDTKK